MIQSESGIPLLEPSAQDTNAPQPSIQSFVVSEEEWAQLKALLDKHYAEIAALLGRSKARDESIQRLSNEVQNYRAGFAFAALKPIINALIAFREECRKSVRDAEKFPLDGEKAKKFILYLISDFEDMLANIGLERNGGAIIINGRQLSGQSAPEATVSETAISGQTGGNSPQVPSNHGQIKNIPELIDYLDRIDADITFALNGRADADRAIFDSITRAARTDAEHYIALAAPVSRRLYRIHDTLCAMSVLVEDGNLSKDWPDAAPERVYSAIINKTVNEIGAILRDANVEMETLSELSDPKRYTILRTIPTDDETRDKTIALAYTDCYAYDGKVIYPSKVGVYKFQQ